MLKRMKSFTVRTAYPSELVQKQIIPFNITHFDISEYYTELSIDVKYITKVSILSYNNERKEYDLELIDMHSKIACVSCKAVLLFNMLRFDWVDAECRKRNYQIQPILHNTYTMEFVDFCILLAVIVCLLCVVKFLVWQDNSINHVPSNTFKNITHQSNRS